MRVGKTDLDVSRLTLGTWAFAGGAVWGEQDAKSSIATVHAALDKGLTTFDSAPGYGDGEAERVLGLALERRRAEAVIATKIPQEQLAYGDVLASCEASLKRLRTDYIDLLQVHWANREIPMEESVRAFRKLKEQGKVRYIGVCNFGPQDMRDWLAAGGEMVSNQLPYSLLSRAIEFEIIPQSRGHGVSILPYTPLMQGLLAGKFASADDVPEGRARFRHFSGTRRSARHGEAGCEAETFAAIGEIGRLAKELGLPMEHLALAWLLHQDTVASVIVGARNADQLLENLRATNVELSPETLVALNKATEDVKQHLGRNPDLWENPGRYR